MIVQTPDGFIDDINPHFYMPSISKSIECQHRYKVTKSSFTMKVSEFFDNWSIFCYSCLDYELDFEKTKIECLKCGLTNTIFRHIF